MKGKWKVKYQWRDVRGTRWHAATVRFETRDRLRVYVKWVRATKYTQYRKMEIVKPKEVNRGKA